MFEHTNFYRQKRALQASLHGMLLHARGHNPTNDPYLLEVAVRHSRGQLSIGAELYDLWLDSLLTSVKEHDPKSTPEVMAAWEQTMTLGIQFFLSHY
jgi:hemoglobin-like flavoprotein